MAGLDAAAGVPGAADKGAGKKPGLKKLLIIGIPVLLLLAGAGAYFSGLLGGGKEDKHAAEAVNKEVAVFYDLPDMLVNLSPTGGRTSYLKMKVALELPDAAASQAIEPIMPRVMDAFQVYLRELRVEDLDGSAGMFRLKEELLRRVNMAAAPVQVRTVLFKEMIVQ